MRQAWNPPCQDLRLQFRTGSISFKQVVPDQKPWSKGRAVEGSSDRLSLRREYELLCTDQSLVASQWLCKSANPILGLSVLSQQRMQLYISLGLPWTGNALILHCHEELSILSLSAWMTLYLYSRKRAPRSVQWIAIYWYVSIIESSQMSLLSAQVGWELLSPRGTLSVFQACFHVLCQCPWGSLTVMATLLGSSPLPFFAALHLSAWS